MNIPTSPIFGRRRFLQTAGATLAGAAFLAACGGGGASGKTTLQQWYHQYGEAGTQQAVLKYAKDYSNAQKAVDVKVTWVPGDYQTKLTTALLSKNGPDVFEFWSPDSSWVKQGLLEPLDDLFPPSVKSDFNVANINAFSQNGKIYGVKMIDDTQFFYYRKSLLSQAGIDPTTLTSMDALLAAATELTTSKMKGLFVGNDGGIGQYGMAIFAAGGDYLVDNKIVFNTPDVVASIAQLRTVATSKAVLTGAPTDWTDPSVFVQGLAAIQWCGLWAMPAITQALGDDFDILPWPAHGTNGKPVVPWGGWAEMVNAKGKYVEQSKALVKSLWIDNTQVQQDWCLDYGFHIPPRASAAASATKLQSGPAAEAVKMINTYGRAASPLVDTVMGTALSDATTNIVKNNADPANEIAKAATTCQTELARLLS